MSAGLSGFYRRSMTQRFAALARAGVMTPDAVAELAAGAQLLPLHAADSMVENVVGVFGLPLALGLNLVVDNRRYVVPLVVEEPSIVAALSSTAKLAEQAGGFTTETTERLVVGQVQLLDLADADVGVRALRAGAARLVQMANGHLGNLVRRGGGVRELQARRVELGERGGSSVVVHLFVDTCDAMGANLVNTLCEQVAPTLAEVAGAKKVGLRILSNLTERALVRAKVRLPTEQLAFAAHSGVAVRDGIARASAFADACLHRAVTHNKGIMNGIDAVALATGNDWRAIEANAHAWAGRGAGYRPLSHWRVAADGALEGSLELPLKVGTVGGNLRVNPGVDWTHRVLRVESADELARLMAAVGLAQNFAALRALSTEGIQNGHMALHARSVAASAQVPEALMGAVVAGMLAAGEVKLWKAEALLAQLRGAPASESVTAGLPVAAAAAAEFGPCGRGEAAGKVLLMGEHAVVYGARALALPLPLATVVEARWGAGDGVRVEVPAWQLDEQLRWDDAAPGMHRPLALILRRMDLAGANLHLRVFAKVPRAMGLGSSAALAVATVRALAALLGRVLDDEAVSALAYAAETVAHGTASGVDNTLATLGRPLTFCRREGVVIAPLALPVPLHLVVGQTQEPSLTATTVARVAAAARTNPGPYQRLFADVDRLVGEGLQALADGELGGLGLAMNLNHGLLNALQVSTPALERAIFVARGAGALGAKLTGGGGGGSMVALCANAGAAAAVASSLEAAGFATLRAHLAATAQPTPSFASPSVPAPVPTHGSQPAPTDAKGVCRG